MKKHLDGLFALIAFLVFMAVVILLTSCDRALRKEIESLREELAKQQQYVPLDRDTIRDSIEVVTQKVIEVQKIKEVLTKEDKQLIKDIGVKVSDLESFQKIGMVTRDTVYLEAKDSTDKDSVLRYTDAWIDIEYEPKTKKATVSSRDSLSIVCDGIVKKKFLWFRWGVKGFISRAVNHNPHSQIKYNTFVRKGRK